MNLSRRAFMKGSALTAGALATGALPSLAGAADEPARVYFSKDLSASGLLRLYRLVNQNIAGNIAVKVHTGEPDGPNILPHPRVKTFLEAVPNTRVVECNVL